MAGSRISTRTPQTNLWRYSILSIHVVIFNIHVHIEIRILTNLFCRSTLSFAFSYSSLATWEWSLSTSESTSRSLNEVTWASLCDMIGCWLLVGVACVAWGLVVLNMLDTCSSWSTALFLLSWLRNLVMAPLRAILDWTSRWRQPVQLWDNLNNYSSNPIVFHIMKLLFEKFS